MVLRFLTSKFHLQKLKKNTLLHTTSGITIILRTFSEPIIVKTNELSKYTWILKTEENNYRIKSRVEEGMKTTINTSYGIIETDTNTVTIGPSIKEIIYNFQKILRKADILYSGETLEKKLGEWGMKKFQDRAKSNIHKQLENCQNQITALKEWISKNISEAGKDLEQAYNNLKTAQEHKRTIEKNIRMGSVLKSSESLENKPKRKVKGKPYLIGWTSKNKEVRFGRNQKQNSRLFNLVSRTGNYFLHTGLGIPGSTTILMDENPCPEDLEEAAQFAAVFSKAWNSQLSRVVVDYAPSKFVIEKGEAKYVMKKRTSIKAFVGLEVVYNELNGEWQYVSKSRPGSRTVIPGLDSKELLKKFQLRDVRKLIELLPMKINLEVFLNPSN